MAYRAPRWATTLATAALLTAAAPFAAHAATFELDFGTTQNPNFGTTDNLVMQYANVATGINATITAATPFAALDRHLNGSNGGDARINMQRGNTEEFTLALWDSSVGTGYDTAYNPGMDFDWDLVFYDIDGNAASREIVTFVTPIAYTLTDPTDLGVDTSVPGQVTIIGGGDANVPNLSPTDTEFTEDQAAVAVNVNVSNAASITFILEHTGRNTGRNLFIDGGSLTTALEDFPTTTTPNPATVPLPAPALMLIAGLGALRVASRKRA